MSIFKMPESIASRIDRINREFLWNHLEGKRKIHGVQWDIVCLPKSIGGLGIRKTDEMNIAMLSKWMWSFSQQLDTLWRKVIEEKYEILPGNWKPKMSWIAKNKSLWRGIWLNNEVCWENAKKKLGNGKNT